MSTHGMHFLSGKDAEVAMNLINGFFMLAGRLSVTPVVLYGALIRIAAVFMTGWCCRTTPEAQDEWLRSFGAAVKASALLNAPPQGQS